MTKMSKSRQLWTLGSLPLLGVVSKLYSGPAKEFVHGYVWDTIAPIILYNFPLEDYNIRLNKYLKAGAVLGTASFTELGQYFGYIYGTFDPYDFLAYAAGTAFALGIDKIMESFSKSKVRSIDKLTQ